MELFFILLGAGLLVLGMLGFFIPILPGPLLAFCGLLCLWPTTKCPPGTMLAVFGLITLITTILDYIVPAIGAKKFQCSRAGIWGCTLGTIIGVFFLPLGLILGPFLGALSGELLAGRTTRQAIRSGFGALLGFLCGVAFKFAACIAMTLYYVHCL